MLNSLEVTREAIDAVEGRVVKNFGYGSTEKATTLFSKFFEEYRGIFERKISEATGAFALRGRKRELYQFDLDTLTLVALDAGLCSFEKIRSDNSEVDELTFRLRSIGERVENECYGLAFRKHFADEAHLFEGITKRYSGNKRLRMRIIRNIGKNNKFIYKAWADEDRLNAASWIINGLISGPLFMLDEDKQLTIPEDIVDMLGAIGEQLILKRPRSVPQTGPVIPWTGLFLHIDGLPFPLVRTRQNEITRFLKREIKTGTIDKSIEALNHAQAVRWRINPVVLDLLKVSYDRGFDVDGIPPKRGRKIPKKPDNVEQMSEADLVKFKKERREIKDTNRRYIGDRSILERIMAMSTDLGDQSFWTPMNLDYRGRMYAIPHMNFQNADHVRALFMFDEGQILNEDGIYWLRVHVANCWANGGLDKKPFAERVAWVQENWDMISSTASNPEIDRRWTQAENPFLFYAAANALLEGVRGNLVHIPVSFDGSCSGLQHLCAMTRSQDGRLVNLTKTDVQMDIYQTVADRVRERVLADLSNPEYKDRAERLLHYGITRKLVKRNVMTYNYSSNKRGMSNQIKTDTMKPLSFEILVGNLDKHPFGDEPWSDAYYIASHTFEAIEDIIKEPAEAKKFLRGMAAKFSHEGKPTVWHTPLGFPVMMRYPELTTKSVNLFLNDTGLRYRPASAVELPGIKKGKAQNGIAPNFVHSMDACHLMMVLLACKQEGINSVALVHDSFGCLPNDAPKFRDMIRRTFREMYEQNDVLEQFRNEALEQLDVKPEKVPPVPPKGTLDLSLIEQSEYCFA